MIGLFLLFCMFCILGFFLSWISNIVLKDEIPIGTSVMILIVTGIAGIAYGFAVQGNEALEALSIVVQTVVMAGLLTLSVQAPFKKGIVISLCFSGLMFLIGMLIRSALS